MSRLPLGARSGRKFHDMDTTVGLENTYIERILPVQLSCIISRRDAGFLFERYAATNRFAYQEYQGRQQPVLEFLIDEGRMVKEHLVEEANRTGYRLVGDVKAYADEDRDALVITAHAIDLRPESRGLDKMYEQAEADFKVAVEGYHAQVAALRLEMDSRVVNLKLMGFTMLTLSGLLAVFS